MTVVLPLVLSALGLVSSTAAVPIASTGVKASWPGWDKIAYTFIFGDSYSTTGFNVTGAQPSPANPLGNPAYYGYTSSNGPNWVDFLTRTYNQSFVETVNLAYGGATVDSSLVAQYLPTVLDLVQQVNDEFLPYYSGKDKPSAVPWRCDDTLFGFFFGINDVGNSYGTGINETLNAAIFAQYAAQVEELYQAGARNFLFLNVPPVDRSPGTTDTNVTTEALEKKDIDEFNTGLTTLAKNLSCSYTDATVFEFDTSQVFTDVLDKPDIYPQTSVYKNTTGYCPAYENGTPTPTSFNASCGIPVNEYFWLNTLHPTYPMQNVTAEQVALLLEGASSKYSIEI